MKRRIGDVTLNYVEHGEGRPLLALHGAGVDHRELEGAIEALGSWEGVRRIYLDLPGMGLSTSEGLRGNQHVVTLLGHFLEELDAGPVALLGHSYGAYLARGIVGRYPDAVAGLALLCPVIDESGPLPAHEAVLSDASAYNELPPELRDGFDEYFVIRTAETARRYRDRTVPGIGLVDEPALERIFGNWTIDLGVRPYSRPALIVAGRRDSIAGYTSQVELIESYPGAALAVIEDAGHAVIHERPELLGALIGDWMERVRRVAAG